MSLIQLLSNTPSEMRKRSKSVTTTITKAETSMRNGKKGIKFTAKGRAATDKVYYDVMVELYPDMLPSKKDGVLRYEALDDHTKCYVECTCPAQVFNFEWVLWKAGSSPRRHATNKPPHITNPDMIPGVCKHLYKMLPLALKAMQKISIPE